MDIKLIYFNEQTKVNICHFHNKESYLINYSIKKIVLIIALFFLSILIKYYVLKLKEKLNVYSIGKKFIDKCIKTKNLYNYSISINK